MDQVVEQHTKGGQVLFDSGLGVVLSQLLDIGRHNNRGQLGQGDTSRRSFSNSRSTSRVGNNRQYNVRGMTGITIQMHRGWRIQLRRQGSILVRTGDRHSNPVAGSKDIRGGNQVEGHSTGWSGNSAISSALLR